MYSNYNVLTLPIESDGKYQIGDIFTISDATKRVCNWRILKFDGLKIENIDYCLGVRLHFNWSQWENNNPERPKIEKQSQMHRF